MTLAAAARSGLRDDLEVACWRAIAAAGVPPARPPAVGQPLARGARPSRAARAGGQAAVAARDRAHRAGHGAQPRAAARAAAAVDRPRRAGRRRRRGRRLHLARVRRRHPARLPQALARDGRRRRPRQRPARPSCAPPRRSPARSARGSSPRASSASRSSRRCARWRSTTARAGSSAAPARRGRATRRAARRAPTPGAGHRPARARPRARRTARDASEAVVDHLARRGLLPGRLPRPGGPPALPGRARLLAGLRRAAAERRGSSGACFRTGERAVVDDVGEAPDYLPAVPGVRAEVCFPLRRRRARRRRAQRRVADRDRRRDGGRDRTLRRAAVGAAGGGRRRRRRLARAAAGAHRRRPGRRPRTPRTSCARRSPRALELSGFESGVVALADGHGALYPHLAEGPFGVAFSQLASEELASIAAWVDDGTSSYTVGDTAGRGFVGHEVLRRAGVGSLIVLPLAVAGDRLGLIVVADRANRRPAPRTSSCSSCSAAAGRAGCGWRVIPSCASGRPRPADRPARRRCRRSPARDRQSCSPTSTARRRSTTRRAGGGRRRPARHRRACCASSVPAGGHAFRIGATSSWSPWSRALAVERPPVGQAAELERRSSVPVAASAAARAIEREPVGAGEVVRGPGGDHRERDAGRQGRSARSVAAGDRDPVGANAATRSAPRGRRRALGAAHRGTSGAGSSPPPGRSALRRRYTRSRVRPHRPHRGRGRRPRVGDRAPHARLRHAARASRDDRGAGRRGRAARRRREPRRAARRRSSEDSPVGRFLAKKGPGLHHVAYQVADVERRARGARERRACG